MQPLISVSEGEFLLGEGSGRSVGYRGDGSMWGETTSILELVLVLVVCFWLGRRLRYEMVWRSVPNCLITNVWYVCSTGRREEWRVELQKRSGAGRAALKDDKGWGAAASTDRA